MKTSAGGRHKEALDSFHGLSELDAAVELTHYRLPIRDMALLRYAQIQDVSGNRQPASDAFARLAAQSSCAVLKELAGRFKNETFAIPATAPTMLLREFNLDLQEYKRQKP